MKPGDLILCKFQPKTAGYIEGEGCIDMKHHIKGEYGMIVEQRLDIDHHTILFLKAFIKTFMAIIKDLPD